jgi:hypothetical protein
MLDQVGLNVRKISIMKSPLPPLKDASEASRCLVVDRWSNDGSDSVIVLIVVVVSLIIDDHVVLCKIMQAHMINPIVHRE